MYQRVMVLRYGLEDGQSRTLADVGQELGVCRERARQIQNAAMRMLKSRVNADHADGIELIDLAS
jgi:DNA-directed RNA polymerase sigma subunit (sigma70/sigma32)